ncbi:MAG: hypothetical protein M3178_03650 [Pseudomonadota bacterium]|nr:hypothetical protein [Pseudomonadota bacterium]
MIALAFLMAAIGGPMLAETSGAASEQNQLAQAEYYSRQAERLRHLQMGEIITPVAAVFAVIATVFAAVWSAWTTSRIHRDTQAREREAGRDKRLDEALKRFGDPESPRLRASAAGLLAEMATRHPKYLPIAVNQLFVGLASEDDPLVLEAISDALERVPRSDSYCPTVQISKLHKLMQLQIAQDVINLAEQDKVGGIEGIAGEDTALDDERRYRETLARASGMTQIKDGWLQRNVIECFGGADTDRPKFLALPSSNRRDVEHALFSTGLRIREAVALAEKLLGSEQSAKPMPLNREMFVKRESRWGSPFKASAET